MLQRSNPFKTVREKDVWFVRMMVKVRVPTVHGVTYEIKCQGCDVKYVGKMARNVYTRATEHTDGLARKDK